MQLRGVVMMASLALCACGKDKGKDPGATAAGSAAPSGGSAAPEPAAKKPAGAEEAAKDFVACSLLTAEEATAAFGMEMKPRVPDSTDPEYCNYDGTRPGFLDSIALTVKPGAHMVEGQKRMKDVQEVTGVGDMANYMRVGKTGSLAVAKGGRSVQIAVTVATDEQDPRPIADKAAQVIVPRL